MACLRRLLSNCGMTCVRSRAIGGPLIICCSPVIFISTCRFWSIFSSFQTDPRFQKQKPTFGTDSSIIPELGLSGITVLVPIPFLHFRQGFGCSAVIRPTLKKIMATSNVELYTRHMITPKLSGSQRVTGNPSNATSGGLQAANTTVWRFAKEKECPYERQLYFSVTLNLSQIRWPECGKVAYSGMKGKIVSPGWRRRVNLFKIH